jgi:N-acetylmuramoyl-L-alanine amidase
MKWAAISASFATLGLSACIAMAPSETPGASVETKKVPPTDIVIDRLPDDFPHGGEARTANEIDLIVIHSIGGPTCKDGAVYFTPAGGPAVFWRDWFLDQSNKSIHYVVGREGDIAQQRPELRTAGHVSFGGIMARVNQRSIGIELVNRGNGVEPFPEAQISALKELVAEIAARYDLPPEAIVTHAALDDRVQGECGGQPLRRNLDPGPLFPLDQVRAAIGSHGGE